MKICFVSRATAEHRLGGLEHHLLDLVTGLRGLGHEVHVITTSAVGGKSEAERGSGERGEGGGIHRMAGTSPGDYSLRFFRSLEATVRKLHEQVGFDVIVPVEFAGLFMDPEGFDVPVVPLVHGTMTSEVPLDWRYWARMGWRDRAAAVWRYKARVVLLPAFRRMIRRADGIIVDSEFSRRELLFWAAGGVGGWRRVLEGGRRAAEIAGKTHVAPLGIDLGRYPGAGERREPDGPAGLDELRICMLGRFHKMKGVEIAIRAVGQLKMRGVRCCLSIGGAGEYRREAELLVGELGLGDCICLEGRIAPEDLAGFFGRHDVFLFPDLTQPAFGLVAIEAMAHGLPVVGARSGAIPEVVTPEVGWVYSAWDVSGLADLLAGVAREKGIMREKGRAALAGFDYFTGEKMTARMETILSQLIRAGKKSGGADEARTRDLRRDRPAF